MARAVLLRLAWALATLVGAVSLAFALVVTAPGDPIDLLPNAEAVRATLEARWHLDQPAPVRMLAWWRMVLGGGLGTSLSLRPGTPVAELVAGPVAATARLVAGALVIGQLGGLAAALASEGRRAPVLRALVLAVGLVPVFLLVHAAVLGLNEAAFAAMGAGWIERPGWFALPDQASTLRTVLAMGILGTGSNALVQSHTDLEVALGRLQRAPFVDAARARGEPLAPLLLRHLVPPLAASTAARVGWLLGGTVVVEKLLLLPGAGALLWSAALERDYEVVLALVLLAAMAVVGARLVADLVRLAVDPRLRGTP